MAKPRSIATLDSIPNRPNALWTGRLPPYPRTNELTPAERPARWAAVALLGLGIVIVYGALFAMIPRAQARHPAVAQIPVPTSAPTATYYNQFDFADSVPIVDRQWIVQVIAHARLEAVPLIELIDDRATVAPLQDGSALGLTWHVNGRDQISLDLKSLDGDMRANRELILLHELGHLIDDELVPNSLRDRLVAEVPTSGMCQRGRFGDCAPPEEKFADTFAKWAYRGALSYRYGAGYHVLVPPSLDAWGAPLTRLPRDSALSAPAARAR